MTLKNNPSKVSDGFSRFTGLAALALSPALFGAPAETTPPPSIQIVDLSQSARITTTITNPSTGEWQAEFQLDLKVTGDADPKFRVAEPGIKMTEHFAVIDATSYRHDNIQLSGTSKLPVTVTLIGEHVDRPMRIVIPAAVVPDPAVDRIVLGSLVVAAIIVIIAAVVAHKSIWNDIGTQAWTFDSWATNTAVGAGIVALVVKIIPGADVPYTQLSAILAFLGAIAPIAYNLTTRTVNSTLKGKILFFVLSAILTGGSVFGQLQIAFSALTGSERKIPPLSLEILETVLGLVVLAFVFHLFAGTRDTIIAQSPGATAAMIAPRHMLPGGSFSAL